MDQNEISSKIKSIHDKIMKINIVTKGLSDYVKKFLNDMEIQEDKNMTNQELQKYKNEVNNKITENNNIVNNKFNEYNENLHENKLQNNNNIQYNEIKIDQNDNELVDCKKPIIYQNYKIQQDRIAPNFQNFNYNNLFLKQDDLDENFPHIRQIFNSTSRKMRNIQKVTCLRYSINGKHIQRTQGKNFSKHSGMLHILNNDQRLLQPQIKFNMGIFNQMVDKLNEKYSQKEIEDKSIKLLNTILVFAKNFDYEESINKWPCVRVISIDHQIFIYKNIQIKIEGLNIFQLKYCLIKLQCKLIVSDIQKRNNITRNTNCELEITKNQIDNKQSDDIKKQSESSVQKLMIKKFNMLFKGKLFFD